MDCPVCLETKNNFIYFRCAHHVCAECSVRMVEFNHTECPMCRVCIKEPMPEQTPEPMPQTPEPMPQTPEPMPQTPEPRESRERECLRNFGNGCINECTNDGYVSVAVGLAALGAITSCVVGSIVQMS